MTTVVFVLVLVAIIVGSRILPVEHRDELGGAFGRLLAAAALIWWIVRAGWQRWAGLSAPPIAAWGLALPVLVYLAAVYPLLFTGRLALNLDDPALAGWVALNALGAGTLEELVFRGVVLGVLMRHWGTGRRGVIRSLVVSSLLFSAPHLLNIMAGADLGFTFAQLGWSFSLGMVLAMLVVWGRSVWPAVMVHGVVNAVIHVNRLGTTVAPDARTILLLVAASVPPLIYGAVLLRHRV